MNNKNLNSNKNKCIKGAKTGKKPVVGGGVSERKFCGHCKKLGKTEAEYTSHWPRASIKQGDMVLCPEILKTECTYCHQLGHWASEQYCPAMKAAAFFARDEMKKRPKQVGVGRGGGGGEALVVPKAVSKFAALSMCDSDSDSERDSENPVVEMVAVDEFPVLGKVDTVKKIGPVPVPESGMSYRSAIMNSKPVEAEVDFGSSIKLSGWKRVRFDDIAATVVVSSLPPPPPLVAVKKPWKHNRFVSDWNASSSDDDSDCD